ncbi:MAG: tetratricopeptide repeat protein [Chthoniobacterales bacterium]|nr:tetratricopeptide repeat protein [Chthoniobacterales bacterium]
MFASSWLRFSAARHLLCMLFMAVPGIAPAPAAGSWPGEDAPWLGTAALSGAAEHRVEAMARVAAGILVSDPDPDLAFHHYRRALDIDPSNAALAQEVAGMHLQHGEVPEALSVLKDALKENPKAAPLALRIAGIYVVSLSKFEAAERYAGEALRMAPDEIEPYQMLFSIHRANGRSSEAGRLLRQAEERTNRDPEFWAGLGDLFLRQQRNEGDMHDKAAADAALRHYRHAADLARQDASVLLRALNFFFAGNHLEDAVTCARRLLVLQPSDTPSREKLALALASLGREDEAIMELQTVVDDNPASLLAYRAHGEILIHQGDYAGALEKFEKALLLNDGDPRLYLEIVDLCLKGENTERAVWWLAQARGKFTRLAELPYYEGQLLGRLQRWKEALNAFDMAADVATQYQPSFFTADFHFQRGVAAERAGDHDAAAAYFRTCLEADENYAPALNYLGYMWAERGENLVQAEDFIRRAVAGEPDNPAFLDSLGWVLFQQGRYHEALPPLEQASKLSSPADPTIEEHLGDALDKLGRRHEAIKAWDRAAALEGASPDLPAKLRAARNSAPAGADEAKAARP